jgi:hypothetical protein
MEDVGFTLSWSETDGGAHDLHHLFLQFYTHGSIRCQNLKMCRMTCQWLTMGCKECASQQ